jgi:hypothetical protein
MQTTSPNPSPLFKNYTKPLSAYSRINFRFIGCMVLLGERFVGLSFLDMSVGGNSKTTKTI